MDLLRDLFLGIVQGIIGFMPVSSMGHIVLLGRIYKMDADYMNLLICFLKIGSLAAIIIVMFKDIMKIIIGAFQLIMDVFSNVIIFFKKLAGVDKDGYYVLDTNPYKRLVLMLIVSSAATCVTSLLLKSVADNSFEIPLMTGICFIVCGVIVIFAERLADGKKALRNMGAFDATLIGVAQGLAIMPGISRVALIYAMSRALGYSRNNSIRYTYLLSIPAIVGYSLLSIHGLAGTAVSVSGLINILASTVVCIVFSCLFIKLMLNIVKKGSLIPFALYGLGIGSFVTAFSILF